jgi:hypothetical protein
VFLEKCLLSGRFRGIPLGSGPKHDREERRGRGFLLASRLDGPAVTGDGEQDGKKRHSSHCPSPFLQSCNPAILPFNP